MRWVYWLAGGVGLAFVIAEYGRARSLAACLAAVRSNLTADDQAVFGAQCSELAAGLSFTDALRIGLGGSP